MESADLKTFIFGGCSFTHAADSWAWNQYPRSRVTEQEDKKYPPYLVNWDEERAYVGQFDGQKFINPDLLRMDNGGDDKLEKFSQYHSAAYDSDLKIDPEEFWSNSKKLDNCKVHVQGHGATSPSGSIRKIMYQVHNSDEKIDAIVFQISGMRRSENIVGPLVMGLETRIDSLFIDDLQFIKIWDAVGYLSTKEKHSRSEYHKTLKQLMELSEGGYGFQAMLTNMEALMTLTLFCKANNIKLGYFHGWNNFKRNVDDNFAHGIPGEWIGADSNPQHIDDLYEKYVSPYLIGPDIYTHFYEKTKRADLMLDGDVDLKTGEAIQGGHPSPYAHQTYWNDIVYPFLLKECYNKE